MLSRITVAGFGFSKFTSPQPPGTQAIPAGGEGQQIENTSMPNGRDGPRMVPQCDRQLSGQLFCPPTGKQLLMRLLLSIIIAHEPFL